MIPRCVLFAYTLFLEIKSTLKNKEFYIHNPDVKFLLKK